MKRRKRGDENEKAQAQGQVQVQVQVCTVCVISEEVAMCSHLDALRSQRLCLMREEEEVCPS